VAAERICPVCGAAFRVYPSAIKRGEGTYCSRRCSDPARGRSGAANGNWKGGRFKRSDGYIAVGIGGGEYRLEHDLVMEAHIGRRLERGEQVHHDNEIRDDNRLANLELLTVAEHARLHHPGRDPSKRVVVACLHCGGEFERLRSWIERHPDTYCSRECYRESRRAGHGNECRVEARARADSDGP
jgi:hypothetical protein